MPKNTTKQKKPISISFTNNKGGVGKITMVINIGAALARKGYSVLLIDNDPQKRGMKRSDSRVKAIEKELRSLVDEVLTLFPK